MFNVTVLKMKDIKKYFILILATIFVTILICKYFPKKSNKENRLLKIIPKSSFISCLEQTVPTIKNYNEEVKENEKKDETINKPNFLQEILKTQVSSIEKIENVEEQQKQKEIIGEATQEQIQEQKEKNEQNEKQEEQKNQENMEVAKTRTFYTNYNKQSNTRKL